MSVSEAKADLQAQLNSQALADQVTVSREYVERVLKYVDDIEVWFADFEAKVGGR
ncbi:hypothetical protein [Arthrobacter sp. YC-RL1]|uniref:hypothetical protein n=1 Tax=Arthrobacter sp. YC-RL1 TaxID=1652545 RepID=UPI000A4C91CB|nr:hypothetical protein [Arthrobacter sp. YC-RL1]